MNLIHRRCHHNPFISTLLCASARTTFWPNPSKCGALRFSHSQHSHAEERQEKKVPYVIAPVFFSNGDPHVGHLYSLLLSDAYIRYRRLVGPPDLSPRLILAAAEHGSKIQKAAQENAVDPLVFAMTKSSQYNSLAIMANIDRNDIFRSTERRHRRALLHVWKELSEKQLIYLATHEGWYSVTDECFYTDDEVEQRTDSRTHTAGMVARQTGSVVSKVKEENYMFALSKFREQLLRYYLDNPTAIHPSTQYDRIIKLLSKEHGINDISISRPASEVQWGIQVPENREQMIHTWLDGLVLSLSGAGYPWMGEVNRDMKTLWPPDLQVVGKDTLKFHAIYFPALLMSLDLPLPRKIISHGHWMFNKEKMSKSSGNLVSPSEEVGYQDVDMDMLRWYLLRSSRQVDEDIEWSKIHLRSAEEHITSLLSRLMQPLFSIRILDLLPLKSQTLPLDHAVLFPGKGEQTLPAATIRTALSQLTSRVDQYFAKGEMWEGVEEVVKVLQLAEQMLILGSPWSPKHPPGHTLQLLTWLRETLRITSILLQPIIPQTTSRILANLRVPYVLRSWEYAVPGRDARTEDMRMRNGEVFVSRARERAIWKSLESEHESDVKVKLKNGRDYWDLVHGRGQRWKHNNLYSVTQHQLILPIHMQPSRRTRKRLAIQEERKKREVLANLAAKRRRERESEYGSESGSGSVVELDREVVDEIRRRRSARREMEWRERHLV